MFVGLWSVEGESSLGYAMNASEPPTTLFSLGGQPAPPDARFDVAEVALLPPSARNDFWPLLERALAETPDPKLDALVERFAEAHGAPPARVARVLRICRLLLREAAKRRVTADQFGLDLTLLDTEGTRAVHEVLIPRYEEVQVALRRELLYAALTDHGDLLTRVDWRVDMMKQSQRGHDLETGVVWVTFHYARGQHHDRVTMQVLPDMIEELQRMCAEVLG